MKRVERRVGLVVVVSALDSGNLRVHLGREGVDRVRSPVDVKITKQMFAKLEVDTKNPMPGGCIGELVFDPWNEESMN